MLLLLPKELILSSLLPSTDLGVESPPPWQTISTETVPGHTLLTPSRLLDVNGVLRWQRCNGEFHQVDGSFELQRSTHSEEEYRLHYVGSYTSPNGITSVVTSDLLLPVKPDIAMHKEEKITSPTVNATMVKVEFPGSVTGRELCWIQLTMPLHVNNFDITDAFSDKLFHYAIEYPRFHDY